MRIKLLILDVDGVLTDGTKAYDLNGNTLHKSFADRDFTAIKEFKASGVSVCFLSGDLVVNKAIANNRKIPFYSSRSTSGQLSKLALLPQIFDDFKCSSEETCFVGDDLFDLEVFDQVQLSVCPSNAHYLLKRHASIVLSSASGQCCIQELFETLLSMNYVDEPSLDSIVKLDMLESQKYS